MVREVRNLTDNIRSEYGALVEEVVHVNIAGEGQGNVAPNESDLEPEKEPAAPEKVVESAGSVTN